LDAEIIAAQLVRPEETYTIEEQDENCPRYRAALNLKTAHGIGSGAALLKPRYLWQQTVLNAFKEKRPEALPLKVNLAQRPISARRCEKTPTENDERIAIRQA
jgi:hypothetical protein